MSEPRWVKTGLGKLVSSSGNDASCDTHANIVAEEEEGREGGTRSFPQARGPFRFVAAPQAVPRAVQNG